MNLLKTYTIALTPMDTLFFRNAIPFASGEETWAETSLLPNPSVIWGALFSTLLFEKKILISQKSHLKIKDIYLLRESTSDKSEKRLIPAPLDLFYKIGETGSFAEKYEDAPKMTSNYSGDLPYLTMPDTDEKVENTENCFIDWSDFTENYPRQNGITRIYESSYFAKEVAKIGIARSNDTRTSEDAKLYRMDMSAFESGWKIIVAFEAPLFSPNGFLRLGGEGKTASYELIEDTQTGKPFLYDEKCWFKLYCQTPTFFNKGNGLEELSKLDNAKLKSASIGRPLMVGGFDVAEQEPKPMRKAVPSGSVYVFEGNPHKTSLEIARLFNSDDIEKGFCLHHFIKF